jgi:hypothetical protein
MAVYAMAAYFHRRRLNRSVVVPLCVKALSRGRA